MTPARIARAPERPLIFWLQVSHAGRVPLGGSTRTVPYRTNADGFLPADGHPNPRAHNLIAAELSDWIVASARH